MANRIVLFLFVVYFFKPHNCWFSPKYINCTSVDENFSRFDLCELKKNKSGKEELSIIIILLQVPVTNCRLQLEMINSNYKFAFNNTWDMCAFMNNRQKIRPLMTFYKLIGHYTNLNHSCPYNHDVFINHFEVSNLARLPWPEGDYILKTSWIVDKKVRLTVDIPFVIKKK